MLFLLLALLAVHSPYLNFYSLVCIHLILNYSHILQENQMCQVLLWVCVYNTLRDYCSIPQSFVLQLIIIILSFIK